MKLKLPQISESNHFALDIIIKVIGGIFIICTTWRGIYEFRITKEREFRLELYKEEVLIVKQLIQSTSKMISFDKNSSEFEEGRTLFKQLRAGPIHFMNDTILNKKVTKLYVAIEKYNAGSPNITNDKLNEIAIDLTKYSKQKIEELTELR
ncbi:MAG: hypothetical protein AAGA64_17240 [Bacteroidota bacterium]